MWARNLLFLGLRFLDPIVSRDRRLQFRVFRNRIAQLLLACFDRFPDFRIEQRGYVTVVAIVLISKEIVACAPGIFDERCPQAFNKTSRRLNHR